MDSGTFSTNAWRRILLEAHPNAKKFRLKECPHYKLLRLIFNHSTTTGVLHYSSIQDSPNTDDEDEMDDNSEHGGVHVDIDHEIPNDPLQAELVRGVTTSSRKHTINSQLNRRGKKESRLSQIDDALKAWAEPSKVRTKTSRARTKALLAKVDRYKSGASSEATSVVGKFKSPYWREIFMNMPDERKMA
ncbi:hypothetical protein AAG906_002219 [Vitis piasezkii]